jgi:hypothetical protein
MSSEAQVLPQPRSLGDHVIPEDRVTLIRQHIAMLSETALVVSEDLPFTADLSDLVRVLENEAEDQGA